LNGVTWQFVKDHGVKATTPELRGLTNNGAPLPARSGFDYITAYVLVQPAAGNPCGTQLNDAYVAIQMGGHFGDSDGDGSYNLVSPSAECGVPGLLGEANLVNFASPLSASEQYLFAIDRDCNPNTQNDQVQFIVQGQQNGTAPVVQVVDGLIPANTGTIGGQGVAWETDLLSTARYFDQTGSCPASVDGFLLLHIPNFDKYFASAGLSPAVFNWIVDSGNLSDGVPEDKLDGSVNIANPSLKVTKGPDLSVCKGKTG